MPLNDSFPIRSLAWCFFGVSFSLLPALACIMAEEVRSPFGAKTRAEDSANPKPSDNPSTSSNGRAVGFATEHVDEKRDEAVTEVPAQADNDRRKRIGCCCVATAAVILGGLLLGRFLLRPSDEIDHSADDLSGPDARVITGQVLMMHLNTTTCQQPVGSGDVANTTLAPSCATSEKVAFIYLKPRDARENYTVTVCLVGITEITAAQNVNPELFPSDVTDDNRNIDVPLRCARMKTNTTHYSDFLTWITNTTSEKHRQQEVWDLLSTVASALNASAARGDPTGGEGVNFVETIPSSQMERNNLTAGVTIRFWKNFPVSDNTSILIAGAQMMGWRPANASNSWVERYLLSEFLGVSTQFDRFAETGNVSEEVQNAGATDGGYVFNTSDLRWTGGEIHPFRDNGGRPTPQVNDGEHSPAALIERIGPDSADGRLCNADTADDEKRQDDRMSHEPALAAMDASGVRYSRHNLNPDPFYGTPCLCTAYPCEECSPIISFEGINRNLIGFLGMFKRFSNAVVRAHQLSFNVDVFVSGGTERAPHQGPHRGDDGVYRRPVVGLEACDVRGSHHCGSAVDLSVEGGQLDGFWRAVSWILDTSGPRHPLRAGVTPGGYRWFEFGSLSSIERTRGDHPLHAQMTEAFGDSVFRVKWTRKADHFHLEQLFLPRVSVDSPLTEARFFGRRLATGLTVVAVAFDGPSVVNPQHPVCVALQTIAKGNFAGVPWRKTVEERRFLVGLGAAGNASDADAAANLAFQATHRHMSAQNSFQQRIVLFPHYCVPTPIVTPFCMSLEADYSWGYQRDFSRALVSTRASAIGHGEFNAGGQQLIIEVTGRIVDALTEMHWSQPSVELVRTGNPFPDIKVASCVNFITSFNAVQVVANVFGRHVCSSRGHVDIECQRRRWFPSSCWVRVWYSVEWCTRFQLQWNLLRVTDHAGIKARCATIFTIDTPRFDESPAERPPPTPCPPGSFTVAEREDESPECRLFRPRCNGTWEHEVVTPASRNDRECAPHRNCTPDEVRPFAGNETSDAVCEPIRECNWTWAFALHRPDGVRNWGCRNASTCNFPAQIQLQNHSQFHDTVCEAALPPCADNRYEVSPPTPRSQRRCKNCTECAEYEYELDACTYGRDRLCISYWGCYNFQYLWRGNATHSGGCVNKTRCNYAMQYMAYPGDNVTDSRCEPLRFCAFPTQYILRGATATSNFVCANVSFCNVTTHFVSRPQSWTTDLTCSARRNCDPVTHEVASHGDERNDRICVMRLNFNNCVQNHSCFDAGACAFLSRGAGDGDYGPCHASRRIRCNSTHVETKHFNDMECRHYGHSEVAAQDCTVAVGCGGYGAAPTPAPTPVPTPNSARSVSSAWWVAVLWLLAAAL